MVHIVTCRLERLTSPKSTDPWTILLQKFSKYFTEEIGNSEVSDSQCDEYEDDCLLDVAPCSLVETYRRFRGAYCLHHQGGLYISDTSDSFCQASRRNITEDSSLHTPYI
jgi:hypothetical protein